MNSEGRMAAPRINALAAELAFARSKRSGAVNCNSREPGRLNAKSVVCRDGDGLY